MRNKDENKIGQTYEATLKLVLEKGLAGITMCDISKSAGMATGTLYIYFKSKEELISQLFLVCRTESADFYLKDYREDEHFETGLKKIFLNILEYRLLHFRKFIFLEQCYHSPFISPALRKSSLKALYPLFRLLERGKREKLIRDIDNDLMLGFLLGSINEVVKKAYYTKQKITDRQAACLYQLCWNGIRL